MKYFFSQKNLQTFVLNKQKANFITLPSIFGPNSESILLKLQKQMKKNRFFAEKVVPQSNHVDRLNAVSTKVPKLLWPFYGRKLIKICFGKVYFSRIFIVLLETYSSLLITVLKIFSPTPKHFFSQKYKVKKNEYLFLKKKSKLFLRARTMPNSELFHQKSVRFFRTSSENFWLKI